MQVEWEEEEQAEEEVNVEEVAAAPEVVEHVNEEKAVKAEVEEASLPPQPTPEVVADVVEPVKEEEEAEG